MDNVVTILGICGSLRKDSFNMATLRAAQDLTPENAEVRIFEELGDIPLFNQDYEQTPSKAVVRFKEEIQASDAILFSTPEYNYSIPGVLKNAIDWASRPYGQSAWEGKPVGIMSASGGMLGGARAQYQLRQVFVFLNMFPLNKPEVIIPDVNKKLNERGELTDVHTIEKISELLQALVDWTIQLKAEIIPPQDLNPEKFEYDKHYARSN
jgi:chromate reductase